MFHVTDLFLIYVFVVTLFAADPRARNFEYRGDSPHLLPRAAPEQVLQVPAAAAAAVRCWC